MNSRVLDLDAVKAFVHIAELGSFTRAAEVTRTTQSPVSLKLKRLEERLGCRLIERSPRYVELSARGAAFLVHAHEMLAVHDRALTEIAGVRQRFTIGISDHVAGPELPALIASMNAQDPHLLIEVRIGLSGDLLQSFDRRELDTVIVRFQGGQHDGEILAEEQFGWFAAQDWHHRADEPLPVATMPEPCGGRALDGSFRRRWGRRGCRCRHGQNRRCRVGPAHGPSRRRRRRPQARTSGTAAPTRPPSHTGSRHPSARHGGGALGGVPKRGQIMTA